MLHSYTKLYVHLVWATKNRDRLLGSIMRSKLQQHWLDYPATKDIVIMASSIQNEHVHLLIRVNSDQQVDDIVNYLKASRPTG